ncbi:hypothetical protein ILUMI_26608 [Ignelater luminosus]|uniref:Cilia- and flagella-associated protein 263 n=1 Tax=Ignelater luminosus TaxID=2038154 RepID=A0A8K0C5J7_IGNLU|nr:hypothetical protein ILUMI_26608 [Ignelater luminosus]
MREMEEMQIALEKFIKRSHRIKCNLKAELEEIGIRESEVTEARDIFEQKIVIEGVDSLTQRIPAEKFLRYMEEWLRSAESTIEKMRLRTSTLKSMFTKLSNQLIQKEELGEAIDAVDFDQLRIENQHLAEKIEQKNTHLLELKRMNGTANLVLSTNKKYLQKQVQDLSTVKNNIKFQEQKIIELDKESYDVEKEVAKVKQKYEEIVDLRENYKVPDTLEYIRTKAELEDLKKSVKMWERKNHIQQFALNTSIRKMKALTGIKKPRPSWFEFREMEKEESWLSLFDNDLHYEDAKSNTYSRQSYNI